GEVFEDLEGELGVATGFGGEGLGGAGLAGGLEGGGELELERDDAGGGLLAGFDAGPMVGVDADERGVEADGAFVEGDEHAEGAGGDVGHGDGDGPAVFLGEGVAGAEVQALEVVA